MTNTLKNEVEVPDAAVDELHIAALQHIQAKDYAAAEKNLRACLDKSKAGKIRRSLGIVLQAQRRFDEGEEFLLEALDIEGDNDHETLFAIANLLLEKGDLLYAFGYYMMAIQACPGNLLYMQKFLDAAGCVPFGEHNQILDDILLQCLKSPDTDFTHAQIIWYTNLMAYKPFYALYTDPGIFKKDFDPAPLLRSYFVEGLKRIVVYQAGFETFVQNLRQWLLYGLEASEKMPGKMPEKSQYAALADAVAVYCFAAEYIMDETDEERLAVEKLKNGIEAGTSADPLMTAVYSCYRRVDSLKNMKGLLTGLPAASGVAKMIRDLDALVSIKPSIQSGQGISRDVSRAVQQQYEEFPYPRWDCLPITTLQTSVFDARAPEVLIAGCGTGREALMWAAHYPQGRITAIDLSRASLSYGIMKAQRYSISNIAFMQEDILNLDAVANKYDMIVSSGVLHHMQDPLKGWQVLCGLLKSGGSMRIGLYSKISRQAVDAGRDVIRRNNFGHDRESMLRFRKNSAGLLDPTTLADLQDRGDYYTLSMYRDLLFHVEEHCFTIPEIESALAGMGLIFLGFEVKGDGLQEYRKRFPDDPRGVSLKNWHLFEQDNTRTFRNMYNFWCQKA